MRAPIIALCLLLLAGGAVVGLWLARATTTRFHGSGPVLVATATTATPAPPPVAPGPAGPGVAPEVRAAERAAPLDAATRSVGGDAEVEEDDFYPREFPPGEVVEEDYPNGQPRYRGHQLQLEDGTWVRHGPWELFDLDGSPHERGAYDHGVEHGEWRWWTPSGALLAHGRFEHGERVGHWSFWWDNGNLQATGEYVDGLGHGPWELYFPDGVKSRQGNMLHGVVSGYWLVWNEDGTPNEAATGFYEAGERVDD